MSDACFHNFEFNQMIYKAISTDDFPSALANLVVKTPFPAFFASLFKSSFTPSEDLAILCELFGQSFANRFLQNRDFFSTHRNSIPYTRGIQMCLLGFWPSGPKPCGGNNCYVFPEVLNNRLVSKTLYKYNYLLKKISNKKIHN